MGQSAQKGEVSWSGQCSCVNGGAVVTVENAGGDMKRQVDTFESDSEEFLGQGLGTPAMSSRDELILARRRVFSSHLRSTFNEHYRVIKQVGEGTYGNVFEAEPRISMENLDMDASDGGGSTSSKLPKLHRRVAVKCFKMQAAAPEETGAGQERGIALTTLKESFEKERSILARAEHPHIVKMYECFEERSSLWVVLELCRGGELYEYVAAMAQQRRNTGGAFDEPEGRLYFRQMLHAVGFLHSNRIVHRDIKTENFLLLGDPKTPEGSIIKLCDFGTAVQLSDAMPRAMGRIGTLSYTAPEIYARKGADLCADVWSLGVVLYVLLVGASPFRTTGTESRSETSKRISQGNYDVLRPGWLKLSAGAKDLVTKHLVIEEGKRMKVKDVLRHPWMVPAMPLLALKDQGEDRVMSPISNEGVDLAEYAVHVQKLLHLISRFARLDRLQQLLVSVYAQVTPDSELSALDLPLPWYELFFALDSDDDGRLGFNELAKGLEKLITLSLGSIEPEEAAILNVLVRALDLDGNGYVDWVEWTALALSSSSTLAQQPEPLRTVFRMMDRPSGDGAITAVDLLALLNSDSAGRFVSTAQAQEQAQVLLERWAPEQKQAIAASVPCLYLADLQKLLQAAARECSQPSQRALPWHSGGKPVKAANWLRCCEQAPPDITSDMRLPPAIPAVRPQDAAD